MVQDPECGGCAVGLQCCSGEGSAEEPGFVSPKGNASDTKLDIVMVGLTSYDTVGMITDPEEVIESYGD